MSTKEFAQIGIVTGTLKNSPRLLFEGISFSLIISLVIYLVYKGYYLLKEESKKISMIYAIHLKSMT